MDKAAQIKMYEQKIRNIENKQFLLEIDAEEYENSSAASVINARIRRLDDKIFEIAEVLKKLRA